MLIKIIIWYINYNFVTLQINEQKVRITVNLQ